MTGRLELTAMSANPVWSAPMAVPVELASPIFPGSGLQFLATYAERADWSCARSTASGSKTGSGIDGFIPSLAGENAGAVAKHLTAWSDL